MKHELVEEIEKALAEKCRARSLDDDNDFFAVLEEIDDVVEKWISERCPGCR